MPLSTGRVSDAADRAAAARQHRLRARAVAARRQEPHAGQAMAEDGGEGLPARRALRHQHPPWLAFEPGGRAQRKHPAWADRGRLLGRRQHAREHRQPDQPLGLRHHLLARGKTGARRRRLVLCVVPLPGGRQSGADVRHRGVRRAGGHARVVRAFLPSSGLAGLASAGVGFSALAEVCEERARGAGMPHAASLARASQLAAFIAVLAVMSSSARISARSPFAFAVALAIRHAGFDVELLDESRSEPGFSALFARRPLHALCFNPSAWYLLLFVLPARGKRVCLYQWRPLSRLSPLRFLRAYPLLRFGRHRRGLRSHARPATSGGSFRTKKVVQVGLYTDTDFFRPAADAPQDRQAARERFILAPGDHLRQEGYFRDLAERSGLRVVRLTRNARVAEAVRQDSHPRRCRAGVRRHL